MSLEPHPAIRQALDLAAENYPVEANRAVESMRIVLEGLLNTTRPEEAWSFSTLSEEGFPLEFAFTSFDRTLRYTAEVAGPESRPSARLHQANAVLAKLGANPLPSDLLDTLAGLQTNATLKYGAWVGVHHGPARDLYKIYVEIPPEAGERASAWATELLNAPPVLPSRSPRLRMLAYDHQRLEFYYDIHNLRPSEIETLLRRVGIEGRGGEVLDLLRRAYMRPVHRDLPATKMGYSYAIPLRKDGPVVGTIYHFCSSLFGGDGRTRRALLRFLAEMGWHMPFYEKLSAPLAERRGFLSCHGMFGIVVVPEAPLRVSFGMTPPRAMP
jgi:hypothetical protein